ncbi:hypothetical protein BDR26DRAFT_656504 [Obelidium mucronatum]|nr:hypothetical protein BDR26DRAFT_656504 [Obelidium mucronatum]
MPPPNLKTGDKKPEPDNDASTTAAAPAAASAPHDDSETLNESRANNNRTTSKRSYRRTSAGNTLKSATKKPISNVHHKHKRSSSNESKSFSVVSPSKEQEPDVGKQRVPATMMMPVQSQLHHQITNATKLSSSFTAPTNNDDDNEGDDDADAGGDGQEEEEESDNEKNDANSSYSSDSWGDDGNDDEYSHAGEDDNSDYMCESSSEGSGGYSSGDSDFENESLEDGWNVIASHRQCVRNHEADLRMIDFAQCIANADRLKPIDDPPSSSEEEIEVEELVEEGDGEEEEGVDVYVDGVNGVPGGNNRTYTPPRLVKRRIRRRKLARSLRVTFPPTTKGPDQGYLLGLKTLIYSFEDIWKEYGGGGHVRIDSLPESFRNRTGDIALLAKQQQEDAT